MDTSFLFLVNNREQEAYFIQRGRIISLPACLILFASYTVDLQKQFAFFFPKCLKSNPLLQQTFALAGGLWAPWAGPVSGSSKYLREYHSNGRGEHGRLVARVQYSWHRCETRWTVSTGMHTVTCTLLWEAWAVFVFSPWLSLLSTGLLVLVGLFCLSSNLRLLWL